MSLGREEAPLPQEPFCRGAGLGRPLPIQGIPESGQTKREGGRTMPHPRLYLQ